MWGAQDGRCKALDAAADGYMRGEAAVAHLIEAFESDEQLATATLTPEAVIVAGTAVNQDGRSSSLTVCTCPVAGSYTRLASLVARASNSRFAPLLLFMKSPGSTQVNGPSKPDFNRKHVYKTCYAAGWWVCCMTCIQMLLMAAGTQWTIAAGSDTDSAGGGCHHT